MAKKKLTKAEKIAQMPIESLVTLKGEAGKKQLISYVKTLRTGYNRRVQQFAKRGVYSYAQDAFERNAPAYVGKQLTKLTRNQLIGELARYQSFFQSQTASLSGIRAVNRAQDARIFGTTKGGRPLGSMTEDERKKYWRLYDEYKRQFPAGTFNYTSESVQQILASVVFEPEDRPGKDEEDEFDIHAYRRQHRIPTKMEILNETEARLAENKLEVDLARGGPNVFSGKGPFNT